MDGIARAFYSKGQKMKIYSLKNKEALDQINKITLNFETRLQE